MYLIQSNFGVIIGNFEAVFREGMQLVHYWRNNNDPVLPWYKSEEFANNVSSAPAMIQSNFGKKGNFEVIVKEDDKLRHYWRDNDDPKLSWHKGPLFGDKVGSAPAMIQSNFGKKGNFEVIVKLGDKLRRYFRDNDDPAYPWHREEGWSDNITHQPVFIQSTFGSKGNFEVVTKRGKCLAHFWRNNDVLGFPWSKEVLIHAVVPLGRLPTAGELQARLDQCPYLRNFSVTDDSDVNPNLVNYNCFAWSLGITNQWLLPKVNSKDCSYVSDFDKFYTQPQFGWTVSATGEREYKKRKIALYADGTSPLSVVRHASRETYDCDWHESKCGKAERIMHDKFQLQKGKKIGIIVRYYEKYDANANLDLKP